jgi:hypothetical protein
MGEQKEAEGLVDVEGEEDDKGDTSLPSEPLSEIRKASHVLTNDIIAMISPEGEKVGLGKVSKKLCVKYFTGKQLCFL